MTDLLNELCCDLKALVLQARVDQMASEPLSAEEAEHLLSSDPDECVLSVDPSLRMSFFLRGSNLVSSKTVHRLYPGEVVLLYNTQYPTGEVRYEIGPDTRAYDFKGALKKCLLIVSLRCTKADQELYVPSLFSHGEEDYCEEMLLDLRTIYRTLCKRLELLMSPEEAQGIAKGKIVSVMDETLQRLINPSACIVYLTSNIITLDDSYLALSIVNGVLRRRHDRDVSVATEGAKKLRDIAVEKILAL